MNGDSLGKTGAVKSELLSQNILLFDIGFAHKFAHFSISVVKKFEQSEAAISYRNEQLMKQKISTNFVQYHNF